MPANDIHWLSVSELGAAMRSGKLSAVEIADHFLDRIRRYDPELSAFIYLDEDQVRRDAAEAQRELEKGLDRGPLHGIPVGIKDNIDIRGIPTSCHSKLMKDRPATSDAAVVSRLREAGAVLCGKLSLHEFAIGGGPSTDLPFPSAISPWDRRYYAGGSSSGAGVGLAAGLFPLAIGTDTGGSIRSPASTCGIVGHKPTYGLVPLDGVFPVSQTLDHVGPMARDVGSAEALQRVIADASRLKAASSKDTDITGMRIGYVRHFHDGDMKADERVSALLDDAVERLRSLGVTIKEINLPPLGLFAPAHMIILNSEVWAIHAHWLRSVPEDYGARSRKSILAGAFHSAEHYVRAFHMKRYLTSAVDKVFEEVDVLICANSMDPTPLTDPEDLARASPRHARFPFNLTGHPALAVPVGMVNLPVSIQFVGPAMCDERVFTVARSFEKVSDWNQRHPAGYI